MCLFKEKMKDAIINGLRERIHPKPLLQMSRLYSSKKERVDYSSKIGRSIWEEYTQYILEVMHNDETLVFFIEPAENVHSTVSLYAQAIDLIKGTDYFKRDEENFGFCSKDKGACATNVEPTLEDLARDRYLRVRLDKETAVQIKELKGLVLGASYLS